MDPLVAMLLVPLLIWAGVFAFLWSVDRRVRELERALAQHANASDEAARSRETPETLTR